MMHRNCSCPNCCQEKWALNSAYRNESARTIELAQKAIQAPPCELTQQAIIDLGVKFLMSREFGG